MALWACGCSDYNAGGPDEQVDPSDPPFACTQAFARAFGEPWQLTGGPAVQVQFSADCGRVLAVEQNSGRLVVADLDTRTVRDIHDGVGSARFVPHSEAVLFRVPSQTDARYHALYVAQGDEIHLVDTGVTSVVPAPDGKTYAYLENPDPATGASGLHLASLDRLPPDPVRLASDAVGPPAYTPDGGHLVFLTSPVPHHHESQNIVCDWQAATPTVADTARGYTRALAGEVLVSNLQVSALADRVYAGTGFDCEAQTQDLVGIPLDGGAPIVLVEDQTSLFGPAGLVELADRGRLLHPMLLLGQNRNFLGSELWSTALDGTGSATLADDLMSNAQSCMYFVPFERVSERHVLYIRRDVRDLAAIDLDTRQSWTLAEELYGMFYAASPDGQQVLTFYPEHTAAQLHITPVAGGPGRVLLDDVAGSTGRVAWTASGERVLVLQGVAVNAPRTLLAIDPATAEQEILADDVPPGTGWGTAFVSHPGGWLVAVQKANGLFVRAIP